MFQFQISSFELSANNFLLAVYASLTYVLYRTIFQLFLSPLSAVPGPWYAAVSDFWLLSHVVRLQQCKAIQELFDTYGPVVRIGANKVAFTDAQSAKSVYSMYKFDKSNFYKSFQA